VRLPRDVSGDDLAQEALGSHVTRQMGSHLDPVTTGDYHRGMKAVGVKQLKARLSEYLRLVKTGETVLVTDRDEVVAELRPARRQRGAGVSVEERLQALADAGELTRPSLPKGDWTWKGKGLGLPPGTAARVLHEVRGDRV
jgi:antitoxin (DNA-binding transcriptional repressor) of toxin-antitoxin stability system